MGALDKIKSFGRKLGLGSPATSNDPHIQAYLEHNRRQWSDRPASEDKGVVLVGLFSFNPSIHCYSYVANHLAARDGSAIRTFYFQKNSVPGTTALFESFGAKPGLNYSDATPADRAQAEFLADGFFQGLKTKWDIMQIAVDGVPLGDLIYDTYLRYLAKPTVILDDPDLRGIILDTLIIYFACKNYLATHHVRAVIPDHTVYSQCGVLLRVAAINRIPIYVVYYNPCFLVRKLDYRLERGEHAIQTRWPYYDFRKIFAALPKAEQISGRQRAGDGLRERFAGAVNPLVMPEIAVYGKTGGERLMAETGRPRVLVMLHDFCDAVHLYRRMLFTDFVEWSNYLLERASETDFDWYVKPHPNNLLPARAAMTATNVRCVAELKEKFPKIHFLDSSASNTQLIEEGISAMFTVHGTSAHEYAYFGIPAVTAGENPHTAYDFNIHANSLEEYDDLIKRAGELKLDIDRSDIEELFYMYYMHFYEKDGTSEAHPVDPKLVPSREIDKHGGGSAFFDVCIRSATPERNAVIARYLDGIFSS
jgi:hypothetical protein